MTTEETIAELLFVINCGVEMRAAQARYFKSRSTADLIASKDFEKGFDRLASAVMQGRWRTQQGEARPAAKP